MLRYTANALVKFTKTGHGQARMRGATAILIVWLIVPGTRIGAQTTPRLEIGDVLRVTAPACGVEQQMARYLRLYRDSLTVLADSELVLPVESVTRLEVSRGISDEPTLIGMVTGAVAGIVVGIVIAPGDDSDFSGGSANQTTVGQIGSANGSGGSSTMSGAVVGPVAGALIGTFIGGLVGKNFRKHSWEPVVLEELRMGITLQPTRILVVGWSVRL